MPQPRGISGRKFVWTVLAVLVFCLAAVFLFRDHIHPPLRGTHPVLDAPATRPVTLPATAPSAQAQPPPRIFDDLARRHAPGLSARPTQDRLPLSEAARLIIPEPVHLDSLRQLWITHPEADPLSDVLKRAATQLTHVTQHRIRFVHRWREADGQPRIGVVLEESTGKYLWTDGQSSQALMERDWNWDRAFSLARGFVVPTRTGIAFFQPLPGRLQETLAHSNRSEESSELVAAAAGEDVLAWIPWEHNRTGGVHLSCFFNEQWTILDKKQQWPARLIHVAPLADGSALCLWLDEQNQVRVSAQLLPSEAPDPQTAETIRSLVRQLSDPQPAVRTSASAELARFGPRAWSILEESRQGQPAEVQARLDNLLRARDQPLIGGFRLEPGPAQVISRFGAGGAVIFFPEGGWLPRLDDLPRRVAPLWLGFRPGWPISRLPSELTDPLVPERTRLQPLGDDWIVIDDVLGPHLFAGNHLLPLLKESELNFGRFLGRDAQGRWLFCPPDAQGPTLVIDPAYSDPTPKFPVWRFEVDGGSAGWDEHGWPATRRGGAWALRKDQWTPLEGALRITPSAPLHPFQSGSTTQSAAPLCVDHQGTEYFDGTNNLLALFPDGRRFEWPLPPPIQGTWDRPVLIEAGENRLFLFNAPGRVARILPTPTGNEPFVLEAVFTREIPEVERPRRIWRDPAGRIIIAYDGNGLAICFPDGHIPPAIQQMMPVGQ